MKKNLSRLLCLFLVLMLLCTSALALTVDQARELLETYYVDTIPPDALEQTTIAGMLDVLGDPYTEYFAPTAYQSFLASMQDTDLVGIGISSTMTAQGLLLKEVYADAPAAQAGLLPGDMITAVDGRPTAGETLDVAGGWLRGDEGSSVTLTVLRGGVEQDYTLTRARVVIPATTTTLLDGHVGYIRCTTFGDQTYGHFEEGITTYGDQADRWIVDLRGNLGGNVGAAIDAASAFVGSGVMAYMRMRDGTYEAYGTDKTTLVKGPVIVLVDADTASASELFASAIRDQGAGIVIGTRTYGKGVSQILLDDRTLPDLFTDGSGFKITMGRFFSSGGTTNDKVGIVPHLVVDDSQAERVARLLTAPASASNTSGLLRLDLRWRWYVDLDTATSAEWSDAFAALLAAIPSNAPLWLGAGGADGWQSVTPAEAAERVQATGYESRDFNDVTASDFATAINILATYDILQGDGTGGYAPDRTLTRAEFCSMLAQATGYKSADPEKTRYSDVDPGAWYASSVAALTDAGLLNGYSDGSFRPNATLDHQQFIAVMARLGEKLCMVLSQTAETGPEEPLQAADYAGYDAWARTSVWLMGRSQISFFGQPVSLLWNLPENIPAKSPTTRGEAAASLYALLSYSGLLPA